MEAETNEVTPAQFDDKDPTTHLVNWETTRAPLCPESETARRDEAMYLTRKDIELLSRAMVERGLHNSSDSLRAFHGLLTNMAAWLDAKKGGN
jgi:hypothetical protein